MTYLVCGEALFDCFLDENSSPGAMRIDARAGGSPFNVSIGIARLGGQAALLTGVSEDMLGERLVRVLEAEAVTTRYLVRSDRPTTLSMVGVDRHGHPSYVFYGKGSADRSLAPGETPEIGPEITGFHFGSYSLVVRPVADAFAALAATAGDRFVSVDPNVRPGIEPDLDAWRTRVTEYAGMADLLKISAEDLAILYPDGSADAMAGEWLNQGVSLVIVTDGMDDVQAWTRSGLRLRRRPPRVTVVDTVGAGDSFQAALLARLAQAGEPRAAVRSLGEVELAALLDFAAGAAAITCTRRGADLPRRGEVSIGER